MGWQAGIDLQQGIAETYQWFLQNAAQLREA
jgi:dTDP-D-glucose 4,6-dehydratase